MQLDQRDLSIIQFIARFNQCTSKQIQQLMFNGLTSHTPADRSLRRLVERRYLARIERRLVGGARGGSGQYVYQLGLEGHRMFKDGRWAPARAVSYHSLAITDCYLALVRLERARRLHIRGFTTEPDCHVTIGRYLLKPDLYAELERLDGSNRIRLMLEIDMGTQGQRQITEKFVRYWNAYNAASEDEWPPTGQFVLFVAVDEQRAEELRWLLEKGKPEQRALFRIKTLETLESALA